MNLYENMTDAFAIMNQTQAFGTAIQFIVPPKQKRYTRINFMALISGSTLHSVYILPPQGRTTIAALPATGQAVVTVSADPGVLVATNNIGPGQGLDPVPAGYAPYAANGLAANDIVAIECIDGSLLLTTVSSVAAGTGVQLAVTLNANVPTAGIAVGARFWDFGVAADANYTNVNYGPFKPTVSARSVYHAYDGIFTTPQLHSPILCYNANATAAGIFELISGGYYKTK